MIEGITGTIGSGKSVLLNKRMIDKAVQGRELALNYEFNDQGLYLALRRRGMTHLEARNKIKNTIIIRTYEQMRGLKNRWLGLDEAHFWFFSRMWERVQLADVQFWSLSRKLGVDVTLVTQRWGAVDATVRDLAVDVWHARPLVSREVRLQPFGVGLRLWNLLSPGERWLGMFMYQKVHDTMGSTKQSRQGLMGAVAHKSICTLNPWEARAYDTGRFFTSPLIEEDVRRQRVEYLKNVYLGQLTPLKTCPLCGGLGTSEFTFSLDDIVEGVWRPTSGAASVHDLAHDMTTRSECPVCSGSGYFADPTSIDMDEARAAALAGLLGPEIKAAAESGQSVITRKGGWAGRKNAN